MWSSSWNRDRGESSFRLLLHFKVEVMSNRSCQGEGCIIVRSAKLLDEQQVKVLADEA